MSSLQASALLSELQTISQKPAVLATRVALLEASNQEAAALQLITQIQTAQSADKQTTKAEKAAIGKGLLPIVARLQLKVSKAAA